MTHRVVWPITILVGLVILVAGISNMQAQLPGSGMGMMMPPQPGRFVVAYGSATKVIILDTGTGKLYAAGEKDFAKASELPKFGMPGMRFPRPPKDKEIVPRLIDKDKPPPVRDLKKRVDRDKKEKKEEDKKQE